MIVDQLNDLRAYPRMHKLETRTRQQLEKAVIASVSGRIGQLLEGSLKKVVNATGVVLHTGMGRAPVHPDYVEKLKAVSRYANLEIRLEDGKRGQRNDHLSEILRLLTGAEDGLAVNNNAAAVMLMLNTIGRNKEVIISRGELIEIGGSFRMPDVMRISGCKLREVGTTNKTHLSDYEQAISPKTGAILICHPSNYTIEGFAQKPQIEDIVALGRKYKVPVAFDLGSGSLIDTAVFGSDSEPVVAEMVAYGLDLISFSGDKLLGGPQAGIIVGKQYWVKKCRKNQMLRALRLDKFMIKMLQMILGEYLYTDHALERLDSIRALTLSADQLKERCEQFVNRLPASVRKQCTLKATTGRVGSGAYPIMELDTWAIAVTPEGISANALAAKLRNRPTPVFSYIDEDTVCLDLRTITVEEEAVILSALQDILKS